MKMTKVLLASWIIAAAFLLTGLAKPASAEELIVVATKATQEATQNWQAFLKTKEVPFKLMTPQEFAMDKNYKYVVIMGSMDESEEMKDLLKEALNDNDMNFISQEGNGKMFLRPNVWMSGQRVLIFAGSSREAEIEARKASRDDWFEHLADWFDIETAEGLRSY